MFRVDVQFECGHCKLASLERSVRTGYRDKSDQMQRNVPEYFNLPDPLRTLLQIYLSPLLLFVVHQRPW